MIRAAGIGCQLAALRASQNPFPYESRISVPHAIGSLPVHTDIRGVGEAVGRSSALAYKRGEMGTTSDESCVDESCKPLYVCHWIASTDQHAAHMGTEKITSCGVCGDGASPRS